MCCLKGSGFEGGGGGRGVWRLSRFGVPLMSRERVPEVRTWLSRSPWLKGLLAGVLQGQGCAPTLKAIEKIPHELPGCGRGRTGVGRYQMVYGRGGKLHLKSNNCILDIIIRGNFSFFCLRATIPLSDRGRA